MKKTKTVPHLSLVIACYNEAEHLEKSFVKLLHVLKQLHSPFEIIFVDDHSKDQTVKIIKKIIKQHTGVTFKLILHKENRGRGKTVADGIRISEGEIVGFIDIDLEISPGYIPDFVRTVAKSADVAVGWRRYAFSLSSLHRTFLSKGYTLLVRSILGLPFHDTETGYKFFKKSKILKILKQTKDERWFWDTEILALSHLHGLKIIEKPVFFTRDPHKTSTVKVIPDTVYYFKRLIEFKKFLRSYKNRTGEYRQVNSHVKALIGVIKKIYSVNNLPLPSKIYLSLRLFMLPLSDIHKAVPLSGTILDLGCGVGSLSFYLSDRSRKRRMIGWDTDSHRIERAQIIAGKKSTAVFENKNVIHARIPRISAAIASDFLHHISYNSQERVIDNVTISFRKRGVFIIKEIDRNDGVRYIFSSLWDRLLYSGDVICYRSKAEWLRLLRRKGFTVEVKKKVSWFPGSTNLIVAQKTI